MIGDFNFLRNTFIILLQPGFIGVRDGHGNLLLGYAELEDIKFVNNFCLTNGMMDIGLWWMLRFDKEVVPSR